ncbi:MAG: C10 family peptidase [Bacteroidales bacterium]|nr:C10 family peptidase [Bacteroidales bacterium]
MKRFVLVTLVMLLSVGQLLATHVDVNTAKSIGENYVRNNISSLRGFQNSKHVLTISDDKGNACLYIFNIEDKGYYIVSADDRAKPVLAYSNEGCIDVNNILPAMAYYLEHYKNAISYAIENDLKADVEIENEWNTVRTRGVAERNIGKSVEPMVELKWNQVYPYSYFCPTDDNGPGGHVYVGCAADVMAMIMKYWNYPEKGTGSHSYVPEGYPTQSVDFSAAKYDWGNMPVQIFSSSPKKEIEAIALLMYHCSVSVDMKYGAYASSGYSEMVPSAMNKYFSYTEKMSHLYRNQYDLNEWEKLLRDNLDQGFPVYYAGSSPVSGGHAFLCDGYTEDGYFHFNWGWSGMYNGNFAIDALNPTNADYNVNQRAIFDVIPDYAHKCMPKSPVIETETNTVYSKKGVIKVYAPELSDLDEALEVIDKVVILRDNKEVFVTENVAPGSIITFEDEVEGYGIYDYTAYAISNGIVGRRGNASLVYGPTCSWEITASTTSYQGWNGASIKLLSEGKAFEEITVKNSTPVNLSLQVPEGEVSCVWTAPKNRISSLSIKIKNSYGETVYEYSGSSAELQEGEIYSGNNSCDNCMAPESLSAEFAKVDNKEGVMITWEKVGTPQSFKVYRSEDNKDYKEIAIVASSENQYFDHNETNGIYYYQVTAYNDACESMPAVTSDNNSDYVMVEVLSIDENTISAIIYPNPVSERLNISSEGLTNISVYTMLGQKVLGVNLNADEYTLDVKDLNNGVYMLKVSSRKGSFTRRICISK